MNSNTQIGGTPLVGLAEAEVAQRQAQGLVNVARAKAGRSYAQIAKDNLLTFFNLVLFSLGLILWALGSPRDAFFTAAIALLNAVVGTVQEVRAKRKLDRIALLTRPKATVIRAGQTQQIDPAAVVVDDLLVVGPGDQALVDGPVVQGAADFDEALLTGEADAVPKQVGDQVLSGSYVLTGKLVYQAQKVGDASFANQLVQRARQFTREQTPLQREVNLVVSRPPYRARSTWWCGCCYWWWPSSASSSPSTSSSTATRICCKACKRPRWSLAWPRPASS